MTVTKLGTCQPTILPLFTFAQFFYRLTLVLLLLCSGQVVGKRLCELGCLRQKVRICDDRLFHAILTRLLLRFDAKALYVNNLGRPNADTLSMIVGFLQSI